jgi:hypothetical protein
MKFFDFLVEKSIIENSMKTAAIITIIALLLLPILFRFTLIITTIIKNNKTSSKQSTAEIKQSKKVLFRRTAIIISVCYFSLLVSAIVWAFFLFSDDMNFSTKAVIIVLGLNLVFFSVMGLLVYLWWRYVNKRNLRPQPNSDTKSVIEWENRYADLITKNLGRMVLITFASYILVIGIFILVLYFSA